MTLTAATRHLLLRVVVALTLAGLVAGAGVAVAQNAVAAINPQPGALVDTPTGVSAGEVGSDTLLFDDETSGCCVAPQTARAAARGGDDFVDLYRHVDDVELADIRATGIFRSGPSGTGKYFAETADDAATWGQWLNAGQGGVIGTRVPRSFADELMRWQKLDNIGPARFVPPELLGRLNDVASGIRFL